MLKITSYKPKCQGFKEALIGIPNYPRFNYQLNPTTS